MANNTLTQLNQLQISFKKLLGKAHTNPNFEWFNETLPSSIQLSSDYVFGQSIPSLSSVPSNYTITQNSSGQNVVETVTFTLEEIASSQYDAAHADSVSGTTIDQQAVDSENTSQIHAYKLVLPSNYTTLSSNPNEGADPFTNSRVVADTTGALQVIPESFGVGYRPIVNDSTGTSLSILGEENWVLDPYIGVLWVQDRGGSLKTPASVTASIYIGNYVTTELGNAGDTVDLHISASDGNGFSIANAATASFSSGSAGISVTAGATNTITIGAATDNVTFNNITATGDIIAQNYIVSSSVTYMTQSFSSGSTIFGDSDNDTHQFTGSISILHTGSGYGFQMSGSNFLIDWGNSGSVTMGEYNIGMEYPSFGLGPVTGSGLIISQSFTNEATHHNMVKIGETELVDISGSLYGSDAFLMNVRKKALVISSSDLDKPVANIEAGNTIFYGSTSGRALLELDGDDVILGDSSVGSDTFIDGATIVLRTADLRARVINGTPGDSSHLIFSVNNPSPVTATNTTDAQLLSIPLTSSFTYLGGAVTASAVSSSGLLYASASDDGGTVTTMAVAMYDTASGLFYYTASSALGDTTLLEASASAGIYVSASAGTGFSIGLVQSASFITGSTSGDGLTITAGTGNTITYTLVSVLSSSQQIATDISGAIDAATGSLLTTYTFLSSSQQIATDISGAIDAATGSLSASILGTLNEVEVTSTGPGNITIGLPDNVIIGNNLTVTNDLIVEGTVTSIQTTNLNVSDQFILLNSGSDSTKDGGIIISSGPNNSGSAFYYDAESNRWALTPKNNTLWNVTSETPKQYVVSVSASNATPSSTPSDFGSTNEYYGMMYVDTGDNDGDGNNIWIYA